MLFQYLSGFEPIFYTTHTNEEPNNVTNLQNTKDALICMSVTLQKIVKLYETTEADICKNMPSKEKIFLRSNAPKVPSSIIKIPGLIEKIKELADSILEIFTVLSLFGIPSEHKK